MFRDRLKELRKLNGYTQESLAAELGLERSAVGKYESPKANAMPSAEILNKLAELFNVSVDYLLGRNEGKKEEPSLDEELDGVDFALRDGTKRLSKKKKEALLSYLRFLEQEEEKEE